MSITLREDQIASLPIHDADFLRFSIAETKDGVASAELDVSGLDHSYDPGYKCPERNGITRILFESCVSLAGQFWAASTNGDSIDRLDVVGVSEFSDKMKALAARLETKTIALRLVLHSGSVFEILAERVVLTTP